MPNLPLPVNLHRLACVALAAAPLICAPRFASSQAQTDPSRPPALSTPDPAAAALRDRMVRAYRSVRAIHEKVTQRQWETRPEDALTLEIELRYRKPNRLYLAIDYPNVSQPGRWQLIYACDGKTLTVYNGARNEYETVKSPSRLDRLILPQALRGPEFITLLRDVSPFDALEKSAIVEYGESADTIGDSQWRTLKLALRQDGAKRALRYRIGPKDFLVYGLTLSVVPDEDSASPFTEPEVRSGLEATYTLVDTNPRFTDADFRFTPPSGAKERKAERLIVPPKAPTRDPAEREAPR
jgi:outer membrane lipoprotein-sorting protein